MSCHGLACGWTRGRPSTTSPGGRRRASTVSRAFSRPGRVNADTAERDLRGGRRARLPGEPAGPRRCRRPHQMPRAAVVPTSPTRSTPRSSAGAQMRPRRGRLHHRCSPTPRSPRQLRAGVRLERDAGQRRRRRARPARGCPTAAIRMIAKQKPLVVLNREIPDVPCVVTDNARGIAAGRRAPRRLGHDSDHLRRRPGGQLGRRHALAVAARGGRPSWTCGCAASARARADLAGRASARPASPRGRRPTAVIAYNDQLAIGRHQGPARPAVRVPQDVSVVGFDNIAARRARRAGADHRGRAAARRGRDRASRTCSR